MPVRAVLGGQWGDEGKGKIIDYLAEDATVVARYSGGNNAGHTVMNELGTFKFHLVPCGVCWPDTVNLIGNGVVVDPDVLIRELDDIRNDGLPGEVVISDKAHVIMPYHIELDRLEEIRRGNDAIGTTGSGIGPAYADKVERRGIRLGELLDLEDLTLRLPGVIAFKNEVITKIYGGKAIDPELVIDKARRWATRLAPYVRPTGDILAAAIENDRNVLLEGAQGALLDLDHGTYPFVTSSNSTSGGMLSGLGIGAADLTEVVGVFKAYCTRVGAGPFPTELDGATADRIRGDRSGLDSEFGAVTGRARRVGWFDAVAARYSVQVNRLNSIVLTRLDTLDGWDTINICVGYELEGCRIDRFPSDAAVLQRCSPIYEQVAGWSGTTAGVTDVSDLPDGARRYVNRIEELLGVPVQFISTGPFRSDTISLERVLV